MEERKKRYGLVDGIRGFAIVNMVVFYFLYDYLWSMEETSGLETACRFWFNPLLGAGRFGFTCYTSW